MRNASAESKTPGFSLNRYNILLVVVAGLASAGLLYFGTGLHPTWWLLWVAPVPVLAIAPRLRATAAFLLGSMAWILGEMNQWNYLRHVIELPLRIIILFFVIAAVVFGLGGLFTRSFLRRDSLFLVAFAFPVYWVTCEYLTAIMSPHSTWGNLAYTQMDFLPLIQIASVTGLWGISFVVFLFAGTVAALVSGAGELWQRRALAIAVGFVVSAVLVFGERRLQSNPSAKSLPITLIAKDVPMSLYLGSEDQARELLHEYADEILNVTPAGTQVVVGLVRRTSSGSFNSSRFYSADRKLQANYDKHHLIPAVEPETPGDKRIILDESSGRWGLQVCKDMDFPKLSREYAADGVDLMLVPAWDFNVDRWLHSRMAVLRAVENGFALARSARNGLLTLSNNRGRILAEAATVPDRFVSITGKVNVASEKTLYTRVGDWFAWLCVAMFIILLAFQLLTRTWTREKH